MPTTRSRVVGRAATERIQTTAIGATDGNIMAAIITSQTDRNAASESPIVPAPTPIGPTQVIVATQASAAIRHRPIHQGRSLLSEIPSGGSASTSVSALIREVGDETVGAGELRVPVVVVANRASFRLSHRLCNGAQ